MNKFTFLLAALLTISSSAFAVSSDECPILKNARKQQTLFADNTAFQPERVSSQHSVSQQHNKSTVDQ